MNYEYPFKTVYIAALYKAINWKGVRWNETIGYILSTVSADETNPSIIFNTEKDHLQHLTTEPENQNNSLSSRCEEMSREINRLKGKPQRRSIAIRCYNIECKGDSVDYEGFNHQLK